MELNHFKGVDMSRRMIGSTIVLAGLAMFAAFGALAQDYKVRSWAASCAACHGTDGKSDGAMPSIAGRSKADLLTLLRDFKYDKRPGATVMHQHAKGYTDAQLELLADHFSSQPR